MPPRPRFPTSQKRRPLWDRTTTRSLSPHRTSAEWPTASSAVAGTNRIARLAAIGSFGTSHWMRSTIATAEPRDAAILGVQLGLEALGRLARRRRGIHDSHDETRSLHAPIGAGDEHETSADGDSLLLMSLCQGSAVDLFVR